MKDKKEIIKEAIDIVGELSDWKLEDMLRFFMEKRDTWGGLSPMQLIDVDKGESIINFLLRFRDGDPIS